MVLESLIAIPILALAVIFQSAVLSRMPLLMGTTDLAMLVVACWAVQQRVRSTWIWAITAGLLATLATNLPAGTYFVAYGLVAGIALAIRRRVWQAPLLATLAIVFIGTLMVQGVSLAAIAATGTFLPLGDALNLVILPSLLLNLLLSIPVYALLRDLAGWFYPDDNEI